MPVSYNESLKHKELGSYISCSYSGKDQSNEGEIKMGDETHKELEWREPTNIPDGKHTGEITRVEFRTEPYRYTDIFVKIDDTDVELKYGCPTILSENSKLGRLAITFGAKYEKAKKEDVEKLFKGRKVDFMTINKKDGNKEFARIVEDSLKPQ